MLVRMAKCCGPVPGDDIIGFVWGWQNSDQFYMMSWKQSYQGWFGCNGNAGITVKLVEPANGNGGAPTVREIEFTTDEGPRRDTSVEALAKLRPVQEGGTVTFGAQTHPADGNAGLVLCSRERAGQLSKDTAMVVQVLGYGEARVDKGFMPMAVVPAPSPGTR